MKIFVFIIFIYSLSVCLCKDNQAGKLMDSISSKIKNESKTSEAIKNITGLPLLAPQLLNTTQQTLKIVQLNNEINSDIEAIKNFSHTNMIDENVLVPNDTLEIQNETIPLHSVNLNSVDINLINATHFTLNDSLNEEKFFKIDSNFNAKYISSIINGTCDLDVNNTLVCKNPDLNYEPIKIMNFTGTDGKKMLAAVKTYYRLCKTVGEKNICKNYELDDSNNYTQSKPVSSSTVAPTVDNQDNNQTIPITYQSPTLLALLFKSNWAAIINAYYYNLKNYLNMKNEITQQQINQYFNQINSYYRNLNEQLMRANADQVDNHFYPFINSYFYKRKAE